LPEFCFKINLARLDKESLIMVETASTMLALGTSAPEFQLPDVVSGKTISLATFSSSKALLVMFICQHCPFVKHVQSELAKIGHDYSDRPLSIVAISANDVANYPDDSPEKLKQMAQELQFNFPVCYDESQAVSKSYTAACTPDFFLFDGSSKLVYRGQLDDSRPSSEVPVTGRDLRQAINAVLQDQEINAEQKPSIGCNIKWKPGNEPEYFG
jgi:peroxiredoxin